MSHAIGAGMVLLSILLLFLGQDFGLSSAGALVWMALFLGLAMMPIGAVLTVVPIRWAPWGMIGVGTLGFVVAVGLAVGTGGHNPASALFVVVLPAVGVPSIITGAVILWRRRRPSEGNWEDYPPV